MKRSRSNCHSGAKRRGLNHGRLCMTVQKCAHRQRPLIGRRVRPYSPLASRGRSGACVLAAALNIGPHPAAVLTSLAAPCAFADLDGVLARVVRSPRGAAGLDHQGVGRQDPEPPCIRHCGAFPAFGPVFPRHLKSGPGGPASVAAGEGSPVTSEDSWPFRCFGHHVGASDVESNLYVQLQSSCTLGRNMGFQLGPYTNIA